MRSGRAERLVHAVEVASAAEPCGGPPPLPLSVHLALEALEGIPRDLQSILRGYLERQLRREPVRVGQDKDLAAR